jgi:hypothetical protein
VVGKENLRGQDHNNWQGLLVWAKVVVLLVQGWVLVQVQVLGLVQVQGE